MITIQEILERKSLYVLWEAKSVMASCRVDLAPTALPQVPQHCQLHKTYTSIIIINKKNQTLKSNQFCKCLQFCMPVSKTTTDLQINEIKKILHPRFLWRF